MYKPPPAAASASQKASSMPAANLTRPGRTIGKTNHRIYTGNHPGARSPWLPLHLGAFLKTPQSMSPPSQKSAFHRSAIQGNVRLIANLSKSETPFSRIQHRHETTRFPLEIVPYIAQGRGSGRTSSLSSWCLSRFSPTLHLSASPLANYLPSVGVRDPPRWPGCSCGMTFLLAAAPAAGAPAAGAGVSLSGGRGEPGSTPPNIFIAANETAPSSSLTPLVWRPHRYRISQKHPAGHTTIRYQLRSHATLDDVFAPAEPAEPANHVRRLLPASLHHRHEA